MTQTAVFILGLGLSSAVNAMSLATATKVGCDVDIRTRTSFTGRCDSDEVVQSIDSLNPFRIKCGEIQVKCPTVASTRSPETSPDTRLDDEAVLETADQDQ